MRRLVLASLLFVAATTPAAIVPPTALADGDDLLAGLSGARALELATELASDKYQGRRTGTPGGRMTEEWLQSEVGGFGLHPMDGEGIYFHAFSFGTMVVKPPIGLSIAGKAAAYGPDFVDLTYTGAGVAEAEVVFVGYGIVAKDRGIDDYEGLDVKGKIVLAVRGAPAHRESELVEEKFIGVKSAAAADRGATGFLICEDKRTIQGSIQERYFRPRLPAVWVSSSVVDGLLAAGAKAKEPTTLATWRAASDAGEPAPGRSIGVKVRLEVNGTFTPNAEGRNVIAGWNGRDPDVRSEVILVGAHHDHLGTDAEGRVFNGADDNASGAASLLALAETLYNNGWKPRRTVVFAWFAGEEQGLVGSRRLAEEVPFPMKNVVAMINMDMTGQGVPAVKLGGGDGFPAMWKRVVSLVPAADQAGFKPFWVEENSDHWPYRERGIPAFFAVTDGDHPNYHQLTDDVANLKPACMEAAARVVGRILIGLADEGKPLSTGREAAEYALREGPRVVDGPAASKALATILARAGGAPVDRTALLDAGYAAITTVIDERAPADGATWTRLDDAVRRRVAEAVLVRSAADLVGGPKAGRVAVLPLYVCPDSARTSPTELGSLRERGVRWIDPFDPKRPPTDAERDAILGSAAKARLIVDLTGLPAASLAAARAAMKNAPATWRASTPLGADLAAATKSLAALRATLGPDTLVLLSGGADEPVLTSAFLAASDAPGLAPVAVVSDDTARLEERLAPVSADLADPKGSMRARVRALFGGAWASLLGRIR